LPPSEAQSGLAAEALGDHRPPAIDPAQVIDDGQGDLGECVAGAIRLRIIRR
jgi:hypothetical protein